MQEWNSVFLGIFAVDTQRQSAISASSFLVHGLAKHGDLATGRGTKAIWAKQTHFAAGAMAGLATFGRGA